MLNDVNHLCTDQVLVLVSLVDPGDLGHEGVVRVGVAEQGADREQHLVEREGEGGTTTMRVTDMCPNKIDNCWAAYTI